MHAHSLLYTYIKKLMEPSSRQNYIGGIVEFHTYITINSLKNQTGWHRWHVDELHNYYVYLNQLFIAKS